MCYFDDLGTVTQPGKSQIDNQGFCNTSNAKTTYSGSWNHPGTNLFALCLDNHFMACTHYTSVLWRYPVHCSVKIYFRNYLRALRSLLIMCTTRLKEFHSQPTPILHIIITMVSGLFSLVLGSFLLPLKLLQSNTVFHKALHLSCIHRIKCIYGIGYALDVACL